jgi:hypothetical protein
MSQRWSSRACARPTTVRLFEVRERLASSLNGACLEVVDQNRPRPAAFQGADSVGESVVALLELGQEGHVVAPGNLSNRLLDKFGEL